MDIVVCWFRAGTVGETAVPFSDVLVERQAKERDKTSTDHIRPELYTAMDNKPGKIILRCPG